MERSSSTGSGCGIAGIAGITGITGNNGNSGRAAPPGGGHRALLPALCLLLALVSLPPARALPAPTRDLHIPTRDLHTHHGLNRSRELLEAADASLQRLKELGTLGFECTLEEVDLEDITKNQMNTIKACTAEDPGAGNCPALERTTFDKSKCLQGIYEDLSAYRRELNNFNDHQVLATLDEMMRALSGDRDAPEPVGAASGTPESFRERLRLCRVLQALRLRSVTISRMIGFLSSL